MPIVSIPYGLTLLSNFAPNGVRFGTVSIPYGLTLLSNPSSDFMQGEIVSIPYGLTLLSNTTQSSIVEKEFQSPMD